MVGLLGAGVDFGFFMLFTRVFGFEVVPANMISVFLGVVHNFFWHKYVTFRIKSSVNVKKEIMRFFVVSGCSYIFQQIALPVLILIPLERIDIIGSHEDVVFKIFIMAVVGFSSYAVNRVWTFKNNEA